MNKRSHLIRIRLRSARRVQGQLGSIPGMCRLQPSAPSRRPAFVCMFGAKRCRSPSTHPERSGCADRQSGASIRRVWITLTDSVLRGAHLGVRVADRNNGGGLAARERIDRAYRGKAGLGTPPIGIRLEQLFYFPEETLGDFGRYLWHYTDLAAFQNITKTEIIRLTPLERMNDLQEGQWLWSQLCRVRVQRLAA